MERIPDSDQPDEERADALRDEDPDFADEHSSLSFADEERGGPERAPEPESPRGLGGMDQ
jgi:hypothetical protein